jgi:GNAT superfamily N-acetyltransferase
VNQPDVLAVFDEQMRRHPADSPGVRVEVDERVTRMVASDGSWSAVLWSALGESDAGEVIAAEKARARGSLEWKLYSHDRPADLPDLLKAAGFEPEPSETLLVAEIADLDLPITPLTDVRTVVVDDPAGVATMLRVHDAVFGPGAVHPSVAEAVQTALDLRPRPIEAVVAWAGDEPVSAGRVEFHEGTDFASLWGGGTVPAWRGRGVFSALVAHRALLARDRGFRYLQVDALPTSRPILERMGFHPLAETTPWMYEAGGPDRRWAQATVAGRAGPMSRSMIRRSPGQASSRTSRGICRAA